MSAVGRDKAPAAYRTIGEVAAELDLPQHVLRFWESKFPQIRPRKGPGGRRYYRPADIDLLRRIRKLLHQDGFTIRGAQAALREGGAAAPVESVAAPSDGAPVAGVPPTPKPPQCDLFPPLWGEMDRAEEKRTAVSDALDELRRMRRDILPE